MVANDDYNPERGHVIWITLHPQAGHEQAGRRPAVVLSPGAYNQKVGLALVCPLTNRIKGYPFEVVIPVGLKVTGAILSDQIKSLDWRVRKAEFICTLPEETIAKVLQKVGTLLKAQIASIELREIRTDYQVQNEVSLPPNSVQPGIL